MDYYLRRSSPNSIKPTINNYMFDYNNPYGYMTSGFNDYSGSSGFNTTEYSPYEQTTVELSSNYDNNISNNAFYGNQGFSSKPQNYFSQPQGYSSKPQGYNTQPQEVVKKLKTKKIDEILNQHEYKIETVKSNKVFYKEKCEEEKKLKEREETAFKSKEKKSILEEENKRKEEEEEAKQRNNSQINNYIQQIVDLKNQLNDEKEKNKKLLVENNNLKEKIKELDNEINKIQGLEKQIKLLQNKLDQKNIEIQNILKTNKKPYEITSIEPGEKIIVVNFVSMATQEISNFGLECKNTDLFVSLEERLYEEFPQFKASDAYYLVNTKRIKRFLTLEQNGIKRNDIISIYFIEE